MNEQEMIDRGSAAQGVLENETFLGVTKELMDIYVNTLIETAPNDVKSRESAYFQIKSLQDIFAVLNQRVAAKDNILESHKEIQNNSEEE